MKHSYFFPVFTLLFLTTFCSAQLSKGTKTIGLGGGISASFSKNEFPNSKSKSNTQSVRANTSVGYFLSEKWLLGGSIGMGLSHSGSKTIDNVNNLKPSINNYQISYGLGAFARFYFKNTDKLGVFLFSNIDDYGNFNSIKQVDNPTNVSSKSNNNIFYWSAGAGMHKMLNEQLAAEAVLYYDDNKNLGISAYLRNFIKTLDKTNEDTPPQYIAQNTWLVDANFNTGYNFSSKYFSIGIGGLGGKMVTNRLMLGSSFSMVLGSSSYKSINVSPFVRYYIPISHRLYVFPYIGSSIYSNKNAIGTNSHISFNRGVGYNYFLTKFIAVSGTIDADLSHDGRAQVDGESKNSGSRLNINAGISYFLK